MSPITQKQIVRTTAISLITMLTLALTQAFAQVTRFIDSPQAWVLFVTIFPLIALLCGMVSKVLTGSAWATLLSSAAAFSLVLLVLFSANSLWFAPLYVAVSLIGYGALNLRKLGRRFIRQG